MGYNLLHRPFFKEDETATSEQPACDCSKVIFRNFNMNQLQIHCCFQETDFEKFNKNNPSLLRESSDVKEKEKASNSRAEETKTNDVNNNDNK